VMREANPRIGRSYWTPSRPPRCQPLPPSTQNACSSSRGARSTSRPARCRA
jgi:hypothetical protein